MGSPAIAKTYGSKTKYLMLAFVCLFVFLVNGFAITGFNLLLNTVSTDLNWSAAERAVVSTAYSTGMVWFVLIGGIVADRINIKRAFGGVLLLTGIVLALRGFVTGVTPYYIVMFIFGVLHAFAIPLAGKIIPMWFGSKNLALANGIMTSANPLGQITANMGGPFIIAAIGGRWQTLFILQGVLVAVLAIIIFIFAKNRTNLESELSSNQITSQKDIGLWKNIKEVAKVPQAWLFIIANMFVVGIIFGGSTQFYTVMQVDPRWGLTMAQAGQITAFNNISSMVMYTVFPILIGKFFAKSYERNYRLIAIVCGVCCAILFSIGIQTFSVTAISIIYLITGFMFGQFVPANRVLMLKLPQISGPRAGTALGMYFTFERIGQTIFSGVIGASMVGENINPSGVLSIVYLFYLVAPLCLILTMLIDRSQKKKAAAAAPPAPEAPAT